MFKFIALNKKLGISSFAALGQVKKYFNTKKIGHMGTLDPLAEGVLAVAIGDATKLIPYVSTEPKEYIVEIYFGHTTETLDSEGVDKKLLPEISEKVNCEAKELLLNLEILKNQEFQVPPIFSAIKINGQRAYDLARKGELEQSEVKPKKVTMYSYELLDFTLPIAKLRITTSSGYYVRSLVRDLAELLGVQAFMYSLVRTKVGGFNLANCSDLDADKIIEFELADLIPNYHPIQVAEDVYLKLKNGLPVYHQNTIPNSVENVFVFFANSLVSLCKIEQREEKKYLVPIKNFNL